jgi:hypothetical protein
MDLLAHKIHPPELMPGFITQIRLHYKKIAAARPYAPRFNDYALDYLRHVLGVSK